MNGSNAFPTTAACNCVIRLSAALNGPTDALNHVANSSAVSARLPTIGSASSRFSAVVICTIASRRNCNCTSMFSPACSSVVNGSNTFPTTAACNCVMRLSAALNGPTDALNHVANASAVSGSPVTVGSSNSNRIAATVCTIASRRNCNCTSMFSPTCSSVVNDSNTPPITAACKSVSSPSASPNAPIAAPTPSANVATWSSSSSEIPALNSCNRATSTLKNHATWSSAATTCGPLSSVADAFNAPSSSNPAPNASTTGPAAWAKSSAAASASPAIPPANATSRLTIVASTHAN